MAAAARRPPILGLLGPVCEVTAQVVDREVARQAQAAPDYERWILQALNSDGITGPHWMSMEPLKCPASSNISGIMQQFLSLCQDFPQNSVASGHKAAAAEKVQAAKDDGLGPAATPSRIPPPKASPVKRPCWQESPRETREMLGSPGGHKAAAAEKVQAAKDDGLGPAATPSRIPPPKASPVKRPCWQDRCNCASPVKRAFLQELSPLGENPVCSPGAAQMPQASPLRTWQESTSPEGPDPFATSSKEPGKRHQSQEASPVLERIVQAPSPIRAQLHFGPAKGEVEEAPVLPGGVEEAKASVKNTEAERPPRAPAAPAAFAQDSIIEPTEEVHVPRPAEWHSKALFERPPDSPDAQLKAAPRPRPGKPPVAEVSQVSPERKELTPMKVADRIMMFEKIISPSVRCVANGVAMSSSARLGRPAPVGSGNRGSAACSNERSSGRIVDGSSLFTPVQQAWARPDVKPKELFRSTSDLAMKPGPRPKPEVPKPTPRAKCAAPPRKPPGGGHHAPSGIPRADKENADRELDRHPPLPGQKREALKPRLRVQEVPSNMELKRGMPSMLYKDPALDLRTMTLPPKKPEDNYAISEYGGDSEGEDPAERERMRQKKAVPKWCDDYFSRVRKQQGIDPDSIFGRVPRCVMDDVFPESLYHQVGKKRPARRRGSSGDWKRDRLTRNEIRSYKQRMGQKQSWDEPDMLPSSIA